MEPAQESDVINDVYYLPHNGVHRYEISTTMLRVIFNASANTPQVFHEAVYSFAKKKHRIDNYLKL